MVRAQIRMRGIKSPEVLRAMARIPREEFVPDGMRAYAYEDRALPIGFKATISQPYIVALMTELLDVKPWHRVLEIGTGSGYQAAVLNELAGEVFSIEIVPELARQARETLERLRYGKVAVRAGDGYRGWPDRAPFHRVIVTAAPPEIPKTLTDQLIPGGRLVAPEGGAAETQTLVVIDKSADGRLSRTISIPVMFVPMVTRD